VSLRLIAQFTIKKAVCKGSKKQNIQDSIWTALYFATPQTSLTGGNLQLHNYVKDWTLLVAVYVKKTKVIQLVLTVLLLKTKTCCLWLPLN